MNAPDLVVLQRPSTFETRSVLKAAMLTDLPTQSLDIGSVRHSLAGHDAQRLLPVGSVEFVRAVIAATGIIEPTWQCYPSALLPWLHRELSTTTIRDVIARQAPCFVKPHTTKLFDGFVFPGASAKHNADDHIAAQLQTLAQLDDDTPVLVSSVVDFASEWRVYVMKGVVLGRGRYDADGAEDAGAPSQGEIETMVRAFKTAPAAWALDVGVLDDGRTALVEVNDGWAIGLYSSSDVSSHQYLNFLWCRWCEIVGKGQAEI